MNIGPTVISRRPRRWHLAAAICLVLFVAASLLAYVRLVAIADRITVENCIFGADAREILGGMSKAWYNAIGAHKHYLTRQYFAAGGRVLGWVGIDRRTSGLISAALVGGAFAVSAFLFFLTLRLSIRVALAGTLFLVGANAVSIQFAVTETYLFTATVTLLALTALVLIDRRRDLVGWQRTALAVGASAVAGLAHMPAAAVFAVHVALEHGSPHAMLQRRAMVSIGVALAVLLLISFLPSFLLYREAKWAPDYVHFYARFGNFIDPALIGTHLLNIFVYAFVAPFGHCSCRYVASDIAALLADPFRLLALIALAAVFALAAYGLVRTRSHRRLVLGCALWLLVSTTFYLWFFPYEAMLPATLFVLPIGIVATLGLAEWRRGWLLLAVTGAILLIVNEPLRWPAEAHFLQCCPRERWSPWPRPPDQWDPPVVM